ncbi:MAG: glycosyltransferase family 39 protein [Actinomycetota bacterium]
MSSGAGEPTTAPARRSRSVVVAAVAVGAVLAVSLVLRVVTSSNLWLDEALSVNIARVPLSDLPRVLERDGAPPLYYVLLHFWMLAFGEGNTAVRALSGVISVATFPAMYFAGRRLGGRYAAWAAVLVFATAPYSFRYATETRMYALVMFLVAWGYLAVVRALERPSLGRGALVALVVAALLYTHNWSYYLLATVGIVMLVRAWRGGTAHERRSARWVIAAMVVGGLAYVPWLPTVWYQLGHTGTPWGDPRLPWSGFAAFVGQFSGIGRPFHGAAYGYVLLAAALPLLALFGAAVDARHVDLDLRTRPVVRRELVVGVGSITLGLVLSYASGTAFDGRYASIGAPLLMLAMAMGTLVFADSRVRIGVLSALLAAGIVGGVRNVQDQRTQAGEVAAVIGAEAQPGDVVVYCPDQLGPSVHRVLGGARGLDEVTFPALSGPKRVNWVDYRQRIDATDTDNVARRILERADGARIWYVVSLGYRSVEGRCEELGAAIGARRPELRVRVQFDDVNFFDFMGLTEYPAS